MLRYVITNVDDIAAVTSTFTSFFLFFISVSEFYSIRQFDSLISLRPWSFGPLEVGDPLLAVALPLLTLCCIVYIHTLAHY